MVKKSMYGMLMMLMFLLTFGCGPKDVSTDTGQMIPQDFLNVYMFTSYSKNLSDTVGMMTADLYQREIIDEETKEEIGEAWKIHKRYHNTLQSEVMAWYDELNAGIQRPVGERILELVNEMVLETKTMVRLINKNSDVQIPETLPTRIYQLSKLIKDSGGQNE